MEKDCKEWYERQQKGSGKKRKPKTGAGKKRKPKKQTGAGKKRKPKKQKGAKNKREQENKREQVKNELERKGNPENRRAMVYGED